MPTRTIIDTEERIRKILPKNLIKDLMDNERICPTCGGIGIQVYNNHYGIKGDESVIARNEAFPYMHQTFIPCTNCSNGVVEICEFCGKQLKKYHTKCDCEQQKLLDAEEKERETREMIDKAQEIDVKNAENYIYDYKSDIFFADESEFADDYYEAYASGEHDCANFDEFFDKYVPKILWNCNRTQIHFDAGDMIESACEELHEDAAATISSADEKELQDLLDKWCENQKGTETYAPNFAEYITVRKEWFA